MSITFQSVYISLHLPNRYQIIFRKFWKKNCFKFVLLVKQKFGEPSIKMTGTYTWDFLP